LTDDNAFYSDTKDLSAPQQSPGFISSEARETIALDMVRHFTAPLMQGLPSGTAERIFSNPATDSIDSPSSGEGIDPYSMVAANTWTAVDGDDAKDPGLSVFHEWLGKYLTMPLRYRLRPPSAFFLQSAETATTTTVDTAGTALAATVSTTSTSEQAEKDNKQQIIDKELKGEKGKEEVGGGTKSWNDNDDDDDDDDDDDYDDYDDYDDEDDIDTSILPFSVRSSKHRLATERVFADAESVLRAVVQEECALRRAEGVRMAYMKDTLFIDGEVYPIPKHMSSALASVPDATTTTTTATTSTTASATVTDQALPTPAPTNQVAVPVGAILSDHNIITPAQMQLLVSTTQRTSMNRFIAGLVRSGFFYPVEWPILE